MAGGPALVGGRGSLTSAKPVKTVESYWPYATTLYDYVWRAMPFQAPGSLNADEVYAVSAYILQKSGVIDENTTLDPKSLPKIEMPNAKGFTTAGDLISSSTACPEK
jgi:cytochrome c